MKRIRSNAEKAGIILVKELSPFYPDEHRRYEIMDFYLTLPMLSTLNMKMLAITIFLYQENNNPNKILTKEMLTTTKVKQLLSKANIKDPKENDIIKYSAEFVRYYKKNK